MQHRVRISALLLAAALLAAADAPTDAEWAPVAQAIEAGGTEAVTAVEALTERFPKWADGQRALALARLRADDPSGAWKAARAALGLNRNDTAAAILGIQALATISRFEDAYKVAGMFKEGSDPDGAVAAQAAISALQAGDEERMGEFIAAAKEHAGGKGIALLEFIDAKRAQRSGDLPAAAAALERAIALRADYRDALYELGRVRIVMALAATDQAIALFKQAEDALQSAARLDSTDADSRFALGRARLERGKRLNALGRKDEGGATLRLALAALDEGLQIRPDDRDAKLWKGDALLRLERYEEAAPLLSYALKYGALDRSLPFNLSLALSRSGKPGEAAEALSKVQAKTVDEQLTVAMSAFELGNWSAAERLFHDALGQLPIDTPEQATKRWSTYRYLGHCNRELAAVASPGSIEQAELTELAAKYYKEAGDNGDFPSRHWYMFLQAPISPLHAFVAGRQSLTWNGWWNPPAWKLLAANYGYKVTHGEGIKGAIKFGPAHVMLWLLLSFIPVGLFLKSWLLPDGLYGKPKQASKPGAKPGQPKSASRPGPRKPGTAATVCKPGTGAGKSPSALVPKDSTGPKTPFS